VGSPAGGNGGKKAGKSGGVFGRAGQRVVTGARRSLNMA
jgi:hypothetical protein